MKPINWEELHQTMVLAVTKKVGWNQQTGWNAEAGLDATDKHNFEQYAAHIIPLTLPGVYGWYCDTCNRIRFGGSSRYTNKSCDLKPGCDGTMNKIKPETVPQPKQTTLL